MKNRLLLTSVFLALLICDAPARAFVTTGYLQSPDLPSLEQDKPIERELAGGESHSYRLILASGQYARLAVDQRHINVAVLAFDPEGKKLVESDMFRTGESEVISMVAETAGAYRLEVLSPDKNASKGRYEIKVIDLRAATEQDKSAVVAESLVAEAMWRKA